MIKLLFFDKAINDFSSSLFEAQFSLSGIVGPIVGGYLNKEWGFAFTATQFAYLLIFSFLYNHIKIN